MKIETNSFSKASKFYQEKDYISAINYYQNTIDKNSNPDERAMSYFNIGVSYIKLKKI